MFARITCPACQHQFSIPEGDMGKRHVCPNCQSPFFAGKSVSEAPAAAGYAKTMLGETGATIKFNCPRCKAPQEATSIEAGTKRPCTACGQRLQVPAAPAPAPGQPNLNKTMLAGDEPIAALPPIKYNCPNCKKPLESPAGEAGTKKPCPACGQRMQIPMTSTAGPNLNKTMLASDGGSPAPARGSYSAAPSASSTMPASDAGRSGAAASPFSTRNIVIGVGVLLLLLIVVPAVIRGGKTEDPVAAAKHLLDLEKAKAEVEQRKNDIKRQEQHEEQTRRQLEELTVKLRNQDEQMRENHRSALRAVTDEKLRAQLEEKFESQRRQFDNEKREMEKQQQKILLDAKAAAEASKAALDAAQQKQQTIIQQAPPVMYYPPYHPRYYWWW